MKDETLNKFREEYTTYLEAANSGFKEIEKLKNELEKDPRTIQIEKLKEEMKNDPRTIRLKRLEHFKNFHDYQKREYGYWGYNNSDYAYFEAKSVITGTDTYGILIRYESRIDKDTYVYLDIENFDDYKIEKDKAEEFENGHIIVPNPNRVSEERIRKEFLIGCITMTPEESAKQLIKKYSIKEED